MSDAKRDDNLAVFSAANWNLFCLEYVDDILELDDRAWEEIEERVSSFQKKRGKERVPASENAAIPPRKRARICDDA